jgi:hypothetical protein
MCLILVPFSPGLSFPGPSGQRHDFTYIRAFGKCPNSRPGTKCLATISLSLRDKGHRSLFTVQRWRANLRRYQEGKAGRITYKLSALMVLARNTANRIALRYSLPFLSRADYRKFSRCDRSQLSGPDKRKPSDPSSESLAAYCASR